MPLARRLLIPILAAGALAVAAPAADAIVGGAPAPEGSWPSIARVTKNGAGTCGGTVINPAWVVTAAHCVHDDNGVPIGPGAFGVTTGRRDLRNTAVGQDIPVVEVRVHPAYNNGTKQNDIALMRLASPTLAPPMAVATGAGLAAGQYASPGGVPNTAGWGDLFVDQSGVPDLRQVHLPLLPEATCAAADAGFDPTTMVCAGAPGTDTCQGDSGGPLVVFAGATPVLYGVVSFGTGCARVAGFYTRVTAYNAFLAPALATAVTTTPTPAGDVVAPVLSSVRVPARLRLSGSRLRSNLRVRLRSSERATVTVTMHKLLGSGRTQQLAGTYRKQIPAGGSSVTLPASAWRLRPGRYRLQLRVVDAAGNGATYQAGVRARR